jgi:hypothetical protein
VISPSLFLLLLRSFPAIFFFLEIVGALLIGRTPKGAKNSFWLDP